MGLPGFFKRNKKTVAGTITMKKPSPEQKRFAETVLEIISPSIADYGFLVHRTEIATHYATVIFRKDKCYIKVNSSTYPRDYPYFYNVILGEGDSEDFFEYDWNSVALWRLKVKIDPELKEQEYSFPVGDKVKFSVNNANQELLKYGIAFLQGDLELFYEARKEQNSNRESYKILSPDKNGEYKTSDEPTSVGQKKKYS
jgi:hypothetical protein